jgi:hypothetical protein
VITIVDGEELTRKYKNGRLKNEKTNKRPDEKQKEEKLND